MRVSEYIQSSLPKYNQHCSLQPHHNPGLYFYKIKESKHHKYKNRINTKVILTLQCQPGVKELSRLNVAPICHNGIGSHIHTLEILSD
jgi:hypothetical protein